MRKRNVLAGVAAVVMLLQVIGNAGPATSQTGPVTFSFSPTSGPPGTKITFTGTGCPHDTAATTTTTVAGQPATPTPDGYFYLAQGSTNQPLQPFTSNAQGAFSGEYDTTGVPVGQYSTFVLCLTRTADADKLAFGSPYNVTAPVIPGSTYNPLSPARVLDTRDGTGTGGSTNAVGPAGVIEVKVTGVGGVPATGVTAVALNVTTTQFTGPFSYLTVWPTGSERPLASNLNFNPGPAVPNSVIARVGTDGKVSIYNNLGSVHVVADVQGWFGGGNAGSSYVPRDPVRILDTREGLGAPTAQVGPGGTIELTVLGVGGVPLTGVSTVVLNMTVTRATGPESFLTVWPSGSSRPTASNLNFAGGPPSTNLVIARVGDGGKVAIYNNLGSTDVLADVQGYFAAPVADAALPGSVYWATNPARILDTRNGTGVPGGAQGHLGTGGDLAVQVTGAGGVPSNATAVVLNVTAADSPGPESYLTVYPTGTQRPVASNLNYVAGQTVPNLVIARIGAGGRVNFYNNLGSAAVIADVQGWFTAPV